MKKLSLVHRQKSTSFGSLQEHNAAAVATPPRRGKGCARTHARTRSPRQLRGLQFEYASSLSPAELVRNHHHHEVALRQREHRAARRSPTACGRLLRDEAAGEACGSCPTHRWGSCDPSLLMRLRENAPGSDRASPLRRVCGTWVASMPDCWAPAVLLLVTNFQTEMFIDCVPGRSSSESLVF
jgi:hypothetical protein